MKRKVLGLSLVIACALTLILLTTGPVSAADQPASDPWQVRAIPTPVSGVEPSFLALKGGRISWTGAGSNFSRMYVFNLSTAKNTAFPVTFADSYYFNPSADGPWITYQGHQSGHYDDIYLYDTANGSVQQITYNSAPGDGNDWDPRVQGNRVVWQKDATNADPGIYLYDIFTQTTSQVLAGSQYHDPDIWGDYVVCVKNPAPGTKAGTEIILYNLTTHDVKSIAPNTKDNERPRINGNKVVWASGDVWTGTDTTKSFQIEMYDLTTGATTPLTDNIAGNMNPAIDSDLVAWQTAEPSAIWTYEFATATAVQVSAQGDTVGPPDVDGRSIAWFGTKGLYFALHASDATRFPDVPKDNPYVVAIEGMADKNIIAGYTDGNFGPDDLVTRQQFAKMIVLTMGFTVTTSDTFSFSDVTPTTDTDLYPYHYIAKAAITGLTEGYPDGTFRPLNNITRQQVITMIVRAGSQFLSSPPPDYQGVLSYTDPTHGVNIRIAEFNHLLDGIVGPRAGGGLAGWDTTAYATRAEVAQMLWNLLGKLPPAA